MSQSVIPARTNRSFLFVGVLIIIIGMAMWTVSFIPASGLAPNQTLTQDTLTQSGIVNNPFAGITNVPIANGQPWTNTPYAGVLDGKYAMAYHGTGSITNYLEAQMFNLNVPENATITGIIFQVTGHAGFQSCLNTGTVVPGCSAIAQTFDNSVRLIVGGQPTGIDKAVGGSWPQGTDSIIQWGGSSDTWGTTLQPSDVNRLDFGVAISLKLGCNNNYGTCNPAAYVDFITVTVFYYLPVGQSPPLGTEITATSCINNGQCNVYTYVAYPTTVTATYTLNGQTSLVTTTVNGVNSVTFTLTNTLSYTTTTNQVTTSISVLPLLTTTTGQVGNTATVTNTIGTGQLTTITTTSLSTPYGFGSPQGLNIAGLWLTVIGVLLVVLSLGAGALAGIAGKK